MGNRRLGRRMALVLAALSVGAVSLPLLEAVEAEPGWTARIDFGPAGAPVAAGYVGDAGAPFATDRGFGWVEATSSAPKSMAAAAADRNLTADQRLDTLIAMQGPAGSGRWEHALPAGVYDVTVAVGDARAAGSVHRLAVEGLVAVDRFPDLPRQAALVAEMRGRDLAGSGRPFTTTTVRVTVSDGRLTLDPAGGVNTKILYAEIAQVSLASTTTTSAPTTTTTAPATTTTTRPATTTTTAPPAPADGTLTWTTVQPAPQVRSEAQGAVLGDKFYVFGGYTSNSGTNAWVPSTRADVYDPALNAWSPLAPSPISLTHTGVAVDGRSIYLAGGYTAGPGGSQIFAIPDVFRYDVDTNSWHRMPNLPEARGAGAMVRLGRALHYFGGVNLSRADRGEHWTLDLDQPSAGWRAAAPMPNPRSHMGHTVFDGKIWAIGGERGYNTNGIAQTSVQVWDPVRPGAWTGMPDLPEARSHTAAGVFVLGGQIYMAGGAAGPSQPRPDVFVCDPATGMWRPTTALPGARHSGVAGVVGDAVYYAGGSFSATVYKGMLR